MKIGIMQPYFFPYLGYWQLMNLVDAFVVYDNIEYTKKGWFNRNYYLCGNERHYFTIPLEKSSDFLEVREKKVSSEFDRTKMKRQILTAYRKAPFFAEVYPIFCECVDHTNKNLFEYIYYAICKIKQYLQINTELIVSSSLGIGRELKGKDKVIAICKTLGANVYINSIGGQKLYDKREFEENGMRLLFCKIDEGVEYKQFDKTFVPNLSILDVMMFNSREDIIGLLDRVLLY